MARGIVCRGQRRRGSGRDRGSVRSGVPGVGLGLCGRVGRRGVARQTRELIVCVARSSGGRIAADRATRADLLACRIEGVGVATAAPARTTGRTGRRLIGQATEVARCVGCLVAGGFGAAENDGAFGGTDCATAVEPVVPAPAAASGTRTERATRRAVSAFMEPCPAPPAGRHPARFASSGLGGRRTFAPHRRRWPPGRPRHNPRPAEAGPNGHFGLAVGHPAGRQWRLRGSTRLLD
jgi:hypothetical protein